MKIVKTTNSIWFKVFACALVIFNLYAFIEFRSIKKDNAAEQSIEKTPVVNTNQVTNTAITSPEKPIKVDIGNGFIEVVESEYDSASQTLKVPEDSAAWLTTSQKLGEGGASLIYGHNSNEIFRNVVNKDDSYEINVLDASNKLHRFQKIKSEELDAKNTSILYNLKEREEDLILITCSLDYFSSKRVATYFKELE